MTPALPAKRRTALALAAACFAAPAPAAMAQAGPPPASLIDEQPGKPRVVVLSDIGNEPDDQMSFVRLLLYSNEFDLESIVATTSVWQRRAVRWLRAGRAAGDPETPVPGPRCSTQTDGQGPAAG